MNPISLKFNSCFPATFILGDFMKNIKRLLDFQKKENLHLNTEERENINKSDSEIEEMFIFFLISIAKQGREKFIKSLTRYFQLGEGDDPTLEQFYDIIKNSSKIKLISLVKYQQPLLKKLKIFSNTTHHSSLQQECRLSCSSYSSLSTKYKNEGQGCFGRQSETSLELLAPLSDHSSDSQNYAVAASNIQKRKKQN